MRIVRYARRVFVRITTIALFLAGAVFVSGLYSPAFAAPENDKASLEARREAMFQRILLNPADLDLAFEYATLSSQLGDFEGAITALERMLIFAPGLPRIQLELGVLYYRLGSYATAQNYLELAISGDDVPDIVRQRVAKFLGQINNAQKRNKFAGSILGGIRYQSNANSGPSSANVDLNGVTFVLDNENVEKSDVNAFVAGSLHYDYDLHRQGDLLELDVLFYGAKYLDVSRLDTLVTEVTFGPSFNLQRYGIDNTQLGVYAIGNAVGLDDNLYFSTLGIGTRISGRTAEGKSVRAKAEFRRKWYNNTSKRPRATDRDGYAISAEIAGAAPVSPRMLAHGLIRGERENVDVGFFDNYQISGEIGATMTVTSPFKNSETFGPILYLDVTGGYRHSRYDNPDPSINANEKQKTNELFARATLTIPVVDDMTIVPQVEYRDHGSNYDIYSYSGWSAYVALGKKF